MLYGYTSDEVGKAAIEEWQSKVPAEWGTSYQGERVDLVWSVTTMDFCTVSQR